MLLALIDTDILSELLKNRDAVVIHHGAEYLAQHQRFSISAMTRYEVLRGLKDKAATTQLRHFATFCQHSEVLAITDEVLDRASDLWVEARKGGHPQCDPDLIIAATALVNDRLLITGNTHHFSWIPHLRVDNWRNA